MQENDKIYELNPRYSPKEADVKKESSATTTVIKKKKNLQPQSHF